MAIETVEKILRGGGKRNPLFRGYTTLELTLAIPFVLTVLLGLTDLTAVVQGYTALQAGVRQGIRCVTATDGKCVSVSAAAPTPLFHWYRVQSPPSYIADRFDLRGNGYWLRQPTYRYTEARILDEVSYAVPVTDYTATRWVYPAARAVSYVVRETGGAFITGTSPTQPNFVYRNARSVQYPSNVVVSNGVNEELSLSRTTVDIVTQFALSPSSLPCFRSLELDEGPTALHHPSSAPCPQNRIPALIFVRGAARGHGTGQLRLSITGRHIAESDFGGQRFDIDSSSWRSRNFIPRGVTPGYVSGAFSEEPEYSLYAGKIVLEPGEHVTVTVSIAPGSLNWTDPAMRYRVTEVRIVPAITRSVETAAECPGGVPRGAYLSGAISCSPPYPPATLGSIAVDTTSNLDTTPPVHLPGMVSEPHAEETLQSLTSTPADFIIASTAARTELRTTPCPPNHGVAYPTDHAGFVVDPATLAVCPFEDPQLQRFGVVPTPVRWSERTVALPDGAKFTWSKRDCTHEEPLPEPLQLYPKAIRVTSFGDLFPLAPQTPLDPEFSCADFSLEHQIFDDPEHGGTVPLSAHSAFLGVHTERAESCLEETLRQEAITLGGLNPAAYFTIETHRVDSVYLPGTPTDTCAIFRSGSAGPGERELLTAGAPLPYGEPPAVCAATPCVAELAGFSGDTPSESTADTAHAAAYWGFNEVRSLYPRVRWNCDDHECLNLQILDEGVNVLGRGSLTVPLNFLLGSAVTLRYSDTGAKESTPAQ